MALNSSRKTDVISRIAQIGSPVLVGVMLVFNMALGHWQSVAFMALVFSVVFAFYWFLFAGPADAPVPRMRFPPPPDGVSANNACPQGEDAAGPSADAGGIRVMREGLDAGCSVRGGVGQA